jgi:peptidoglycan/xylan/chitin deacetylase (PgdA/CDA1 family)
VKEQSPVLPVLTYHSLDSSGSPVSVRPDEFRRHVDSLVESGWRTLTLSAAIQGLSAGTWPRRSFLLTFDDGYANVMETGAPTLERHGFTAAMFVITEFVGRRNRWPGQPSWVPDAPLLDWDGLRSLVKLGWDLGAHSRTHARLPSLSLAAAHQEMLASKLDIEDRCGVKVRAFAYPYGARTPAIEALAGETFHASFGTRLACMTPRSAWTNLDRVDAFYLRGSTLVSRLDTPSAVAYLAIRRLARSLTAARR